MENWRRHWPTLLLANAGLIAAYALSGYFGLLLALPPGYATPLYPPAGIALAALVSGGPRLLPGVALAPLALILATSYPGQDPVTSVAVLAALAAALGAVTQAAAGAWLFKRYIAPAIGSGADVLRFLLLAPVMCLASASVSLAGLVALGEMAAGALAPNWLTWWVGDTIGVLLAAPICWTLFGRPRALWSRRLLLVTLPLLLSAGAFIAIYDRAVRWEQDQQLQAFRLKAQQVGDQLQAQFSEHERFVNAMAKALDVPLAEREFRNVARAYLDQRPELLAVTWLQRVPGGSERGFQDWARRRVGPTYTMHDFGHGTLRARPVHYPMLYMEPTPSPLHAGLDFMSEAGRANALERTVALRRPSASAPLAFQGARGAAIVLLQAVGNGSGAPTGVLGVVLGVDAWLAPVLAAGDAGALAAELSDVSDARRPLALQQAIGVPERPHDYRKQLAFGGRSYALRLAPTQQYLQQHRGWQSWTVLTCGLLLTGLLGGMMLLVSGERALIQAQVRDSTAKLREREARLEAILANAADAILTVASDGTLVSANAAAGVLFGYPAEAMPGLRLDQLLPLAADDSAAALLQRLAFSDAAERELHGRRRDGASMPLAVAVSRVSLPDEWLFVCIVHDLTERLRAQEHIYRLAHHDPLTGLENRFALNLHLEQLLAQHRRAGDNVAVLFIDLDHFKKINDSLGHEAGDRLLVAVAQRLRELLRDADTIARLGGDEFIVVMAGDVTPDSVGAVAVRIVEALGAPYQLGGQSAHSGASVGVAMFPADGDDAGVLLRHADTAMYAAKSQGRNNFQFFSPGMNAATHERLLLENRLWAALDEGEFELYLQPQLELGGGAVVGAEALLRWHHPQLGMVGPDRFIPIAEDAGLILPLGEWVLREAVRLLTLWSTDPALRHLRLAVNLSARQCHGAGLLPHLDRLLAASGIDPGRLEMEITESAAMQDPERTRHLLRELRERGIGVAIDDFGTGYSSLSYLKLFAIDRIKIDRAFVKDIESDPNDAVIVAATIGLAHALGLGVVAEGVESEAQAAFLREKGCDEAQGYLFARPMPVAQFDRFMRAAPVEA